MTKQQEAAIARVCAHECLMGELVEALQWALRQIDVVMIETTAAQQRYDDARAVLARAKEQS